MDASDELEIADGLAFRPSFNKSSALYLLLIGTVVAMGCALPMVYLDVSVRSPGVVHTASEVTPLKAIRSGFINNVLVRENSRVVKNELLLTQRVPELDAKLKYTKQRLQDAVLFLKDVLQLIAFAEGKHCSQPLTKNYQQSLLDFTERIHERQHRLEKIARDYNRNKKLYDERVISDAEFDNSRLEYNSAWGDLELVKQSQLSTWNSELKSHQADRLTLSNELIQLQLETSHLEIRAPLKGTLQNLSGIYSGTFLTEGQVIANISPDTALMAEVFVSPADIGLLQIGMNVKIQVDAFNHNQWGTLSARVEAISSDVIQINNTPVFKVMCQLSQTFLTLSNGYRGQLKKGMSLQARFRVAHRSLWQLLYDKADDWISPNANVH